jgi:heme-degrading monooxygenase HmoA
MSAIAGPIRDASLSLALSVREETGGRVISRQWRGIAKRSHAGRYIAHLRTETFPRLAGIRGFLGASILRRDVADGVEFRIVTTWESIEAIGGFAGDKPEQAVVAKEAQDMMVAYDLTVDHYEVVEWVAGCTTNESSPLALSMWRRRAASIRLAAPTGWQERAMRKSTPAASPDAYVAHLCGWQRTCVEHLRQAVREVSVLEEVVKWGHLVYLSNGPVLLIRAEEQRVLFGFWRGQRLQTIEPRLKPGGKYEMAALELRHGIAVSSSTARRLVKEAVALNQSLGNPTHNVRPSKDLKGRRTKRARPWSRQTVTLVR